MIQYKNESILDIFKFLISEMKHSVDGQQAGSRKANKGEPDRPACFDEAVQERAAKNLKEHGFCVVDLYSAREIDEIQKGLKDEVDEECPVNCRPLDDIVLTSEMQASDLFNTTVDVSFCRLAAIFNKRMSDPHNHTLNVGFEFLYHGLLHLRTEPIPAKNPLSCLTFNKDLEKHPTCPNREHCFFFVVPLWGKESRTFLKGSHSGVQNKKMTPVIFQQLGGRENMVNVSVEPGQALIYSFQIFYRLLEKSKEEPNCAFISSCVNLYISKVGIGMDDVLYKKTNHATRLWLAIFHTKPRHWLDEWLKKKSNALAATGNPDNNFGKMRVIIMRIIIDTDSFLQQIVGYGHGVPRNIFKCRDICHSAIAERAATTDFAGSGI